MKTVQISGKVSDLCSYRVYDAEGECILKKEGYHPFGYSDYIELTIDLDTGQIIGWDGSEVKQVIEEQNQSRS